MLASILNIDSDIEIFLTDEEIEKLDSQSLKGQIFELQDVRKIYPLEVLVDRQPFNQRPYLGNLGYVLKKDSYTVFITPDYYIELHSNGLVGGRAGHIKIDIMSEDFAKIHDCFARDLRTIRSRYENRDKIIKKMEKRTD